MNKKMLEIEIKPEGVVLSNFDLTNLNEKEKISLKLHLETLVAELKELLK